MGSVNIPQGMKKLKGRVPQHCLAMPGMQMDSREKGVCSQQKAAVPQKAQPAPRPPTRGCPKLSKGHVNSTIGHPRPQGHSSSPV